jgi:hypothetical protein
MDEMLINFSFVLGKWTATPTPHRPSFLTLLRDVLHRFGYTGTPAYHGHLYHEFGHGHCEVHVDVLTHPSDLSMTAWFTMATSDNLNETLEKVAHHALTEICEHHLLSLDGTVVALFPVQNDGNTTWSERLATVGDPEHPTYHTGWAFTARYA